MPVARRPRLAAAALLTLPARAAEPLDILTSDVRPLSIPPPSTKGPAMGEARRGIVLDIVAAAVRAIGRQPRFTFVSFGESFDRARDVPGTLVAPLGRVPARETLFTWVGKVVDVPQTLGTLAERPVADLAAARAMTRVGVVRGGFQETFLRDNGLMNLVVLETARDLAQALAEGRVDAWYGNATEVALNFEAMGRPGAVRIGPALQVAPAWLGAHLDPRDAPVAELRAAIARLEADGTAGRTYRAYVPA